ncbi:MAG: flotillin-like FloA family protein [Phycisphaerales bacterium]
MAVARSRSTSPRPRRTAYGRPRRGRVPKAMADAFRSGNMGVMDYYKMKNVMADTDMRSSIASPDAKK